ncbi:MAG: aspartate 1-decarboxylase [Deltaproteobacteria bacterium]|nr:aspartate 1-decarboxylase [Deltaproteobacteria bacterium]
MVRTIFKSKIHRATVTHADVDYEGSVSIDRTLLEAADILPFEMVHVWNVTRGTRVGTYAIEGPRDSGVICINGAAAHGNSPGDLVIIATFAQLTPAELRRHVPRVVRVDRKNRIVGTSPELPGPNRPRGDGPRRRRRAPSVLPQA